MNNLTIETIDINTITTYTNNAKIHSDEQIRQISRSIQEFGFNNPVLIDDKNEIIAGHGRYEAAKLLALTEIPVIRLSHLSDEKKRAYRIADNKISEMGGWDKDILKLELSELEIMCEEIHITDTGFNSLEIDSLFVEKPEKTKKEKTETIPYVSDDEIVTKPGDIWIIGPHKVICGDSLQETTYEKLMHDELASMVLTDAPYNVSAASIGNSGKIKHKDFAMAAGEMSDTEFEQFLQQVMQLCSKYSEQSSLGYFWMDWRHSEHILKAGKSVYPLFVNLCVWAKTSGGMGKLYRSQHELCFIFGKSKHYLDNVELGKHGRYRTNVWQYAGVNAFGAHKGDQKYHPTVKPTEMFLDAILDVTPRGGIVLDAFLGSGTTLIAAEKAKRVCRGIEYEPRYVDTTIKRFKDIFGLDAVQESSGKTYSELLAEIKK